MERDSWEPRSPPAGIGAAHPAPECHRERVASTVRQGTTRSRKPPIENRLGNPTVPEVSSS